MARRRELYRGDCLDILDQYIEKESVDLIYLDPPFNSKSTYNLPFKKKDKNLRPVEAFTDFWEWTIDDEVRLDEWRRSNREPLRSIATIIEFAYNIERPAGGGRRKYSLASYLSNMAERLIALRVVLKQSGSIYLHCDPTAGHYLKLLMDAVFGKSNFRNEIVWHYKGAALTSAKQMFPRKHDTIFFYTRGPNNTFVNPREDALSDAMTRRWGKYLETDGKTVLYKSIKHEQSEEARSRARILKEFGREPRDDDIAFTANPSLIRSVWDIPEVRNNPKYKESLGYPTQKPLALLDRIIRASSNPGDVVLDPFCGCGTAIVASESLERQWIGIDISRFSVSLMHERVVDWCHIDSKSIRVFGLPENISDARDLARNEPFEFEKWAAGTIGANGMYKDLGRPGPDGGVDGVMEIITLHSGKVRVETVIIQVKGGKVTPDSVKALSQTVRDRGSIAGILVCFANQMGTVNNQRSRETWHDATGTYPVIQGFSIEDMLAGKRPLLPRRYGITRGGRMTA